MAARQARLVRAATADDVKGFSCPALLDEKAFRVHGRDQLGRGTFGRVLLGTDLTTQEPVAIKRFTRSSSDLDADEEGGGSKCATARYVGLHETLASCLLILVLVVFRGGQKDKLVVDRSTRGALPLVEFATGAAIAPHPNVVRTLGCFTTPETVNIVLELCPEGSLLDQIRSASLGVSRAHELMGQLADALHHVHQAGFVHADVKADNVLLRGDQAKLCDFGSAGRLGTMRGPHVCGTPAYLAPELCHDHGPVPYAVGHDVWPFGVILHGVITGDFPPWDRARVADPQYRAYLEMGGGHFDRASRPYCGLAAPLLDVLEACLTPDPAKRCTMACPLAFFKQLANKASWFCEPRMTLPEFRARFCRSSPASSPCQDRDGDTDSEDGDDSSGTCRDAAEGNAPAGQRLALPVPLSPMGERSRSVCLGTLSAAERQQQQMQRTGSIGSMISSLLLRLTKPQHQKSLPMEDSGTPEK